MDIPKQEKQETVPVFVLRACAIMEKTQKSGEGVKTSAKLAEEAQDKRERIERLESKYVLICEFQKDFFSVVFIGKIVRFRFF